MKNLKNTVLVTLAVLFVRGLSFAQDEGLDIDVSIGDEASKVWYQNPLYWIIGALLLIVLIAFVSRGSKK